MNKFIRFFNQNKKGIIKVIIIIAFAFILLQLVNSLLKPNKSNNNKLQQ